MRECKIEGMCQQVCHQRGFFPQDASFFNNSRANAPPQQLRFDKFQPKTFFFRL